MLRKTIMSLVLVTALTSAVSFAEMTTEVDRFSGITFFKTRYVPRPGIPQLYITTLSKKGAGTYSYLRIIYFDDSWKYSQCHSTYWLIDREPISLPEPTMYAEVLGKAAVEQLVVSKIPFEQLQQLARARKIEYRICHDEYVVTAGEHEDIRETVAYLKKIKGENGRAERESKASEEERLGEERLREWRKND